MKFKRILKIILGVVVFFTLPSLLFFGFMYLKYNEPLPTGEQGYKADVLAKKMLVSLDHEAYNATNYIEFTFKKRHHYKWYKSEQKCDVFWKHHSVTLDLKQHSNSTLAKSENYSENDRKVIIQKALDYFNNDSFWLVAPYKVFDQGVERRLIKTEDNKQALLVTYTSGGSTPGDSYLWHLDSSGKPESFQMWVSILPIDGLKASWSDWTTTDTGVQLPIFHKLLFLGLEIDNLVTN